MNNMQQIGKSVNWLMEINKSFERARDFV